MNECIKIYDMHKICTCSVSLHTSASPSPHAPSCTQPPALSLSSRLCTPAGHERGWGKGCDPSCHSSRAPCSGQCSSATPSVLSPLCSIPPPTPTRLPRSGHRVQGRNRRWADNAERRRAYHTLILRWQRRACVAGLLLTCCQVLCFGAVTLPAPQ